MHFAHFSDGIFTTLGVLPGIPNNNALNANSLSWRFLSKWALCLWESIFSPFSTIVTSLSIPSIKWTSNPQPILFLTILLLETQEFIAKQAYHQSLAQALKQWEIPPNHAGRKMELLETRKLVRLDRWKRLRTTCCLRRTMSPNLYYARDFYQCLRGIKCQSLTLKRRWISLICRTLALLTLPQWILEWLEVLRGEEMVPLNRHSRGHLFLPMTKYPY